ncbi:hypothetical protein C0Q70_01358 [Pomacea canaliculata]|uniref:Uncharacterized protein n=1 Tax=Pomacea canaliculata TaxID=400727 RepID=A0A2T7PZ79_POMCA|nr:hypothetical protein C0Q70_01358 [Pomacea canaliculata]
MERETSRQADRRRKAMSPRTGGALPADANTRYPHCVTEGKEQGKSWETGGSSRCRVAEGQVNQQVYRLISHLDISPPTCTYIIYFTADDDREGLGPTEAILRQYLLYVCLTGLTLIAVNIRRATVFPLVSLLILLIAGIMCFLGHCHISRKILTFVSGILFVLAGEQS